MLANLHEMVIKPTYPLGPTDPIFGARLDRAAAETLAATIRATPAGSWRSDMCPPRRCRYRRGRAAAAAGGAAQLRRRRRREGYQAMPGGAGAGGRRRRGGISIARGARSKDTWVISDGAVSEFIAAAPDGGAGRADPRRRRSAEPRGRQLLLARPLRRAGRGDRAPRRIICSRLAEPAIRSRWPAISAPLVASLRALTMVASGTELAALPPLAEVAAIRIGSCARRCSTRALGLAHRLGARHRQGGPRRSATGCRWTPGPWCRRWRTSSADAGRGGRRAPHRAWRAARSGGR